MDAQLTINELLELELKPGEVLVWWAQPQPKVFARRARPLLLYGIFCTAFLIVLEANILRGSLGGRDEPVPIGAMLICSGLYTCFRSSPYWMRRTAMRTVYGITDRRAFVLEHRRGMITKRESFTADQLANIKQKVYSDGSGNLIFEQRIEYRWWRNTINFIRRGFFGLRNVREVEDKIQENILGRGEKPASAS
jgi:hypothetical protein